MEKIKHIRGFWTFTMNWIFWKCNQDRFERIFNGWHYKFTKFDGNVVLQVWR